MEIKHRDLHRVTSTAIIYKDGKYLILKRSLDKKAFPGQWTVPGGGLEVDDYLDTPKATDDLWYGALEKSLRREVLEECGLEVGRIKYLLDVVFIRPDGVPAVVLSFYCSWLSGEVKLNQENIDHAWVSLEQAREYDLIAGIYEEIEMVDKILRGADENEVEYKKR